MGIGGKKLIAVPLKPEVIYIIVIYNVIIVFYIYIYNENVARSWES